MSDVKQIFSGDPAQLVKALGEISRAYVKLENQVDRLTAAGKRGHEESVRHTQRQAAAFGGFAGGNPWSSAHAANVRGMPGANPWISAHQASQRESQRAAAAARAASEQQSSFNELLGTGVSQVAQLATGYMTVRTIVNFVVGDMERLNRLQAEALAGHQALAAAHAEIALNTFGQSPAVRARLGAEAARISAMTGVPEAAVGRSLGRLAGKGAGFNMDQIVGAQEMASRLGRHTQDQIEPLATAIVQTMRIGGMDVEQSAALIQSASAAAFVTEPWQQARFLQQGVSGMAANIPGGGPKAVEQSLELLAYISQAVGEERGEAGRTSGIAMAAQLDEFRQGRGKWAREVGGWKISRPVSGMPAMPIDAIKWLQSNPAQAKQFLDKATFEQLFEGEWRNLVTGGASANKLLAETQELVRPDVAALREQLQALESGTPQMAQSTLANQGQAITDQYLGRESRQAASKSIKDQRDKAIMMSGSYGGFDRFARPLRFAAQDMLAWATGQQPETHISQIQEMKQRVGTFSMPLPTSLGGNREHRFWNKTDDMLRLEKTLDEMLVNAKLQLAETRKLTTPKPVAAPAQRERGGQSEK